MSTALGQVIARANQTKEAISINDFTRRFVYTGGTPMMSMNPKASGISANPIDGGVLWPILPSQDIHMGSFNDYTQKHTVVKRTVSPLENIVYLKRLFVEGENDLGLRVLESLTKVEHVYGQSEEESYDLAFDYFAVVHPKITCSFGLESVLTSTAPGHMSSKHYQACPTCRLADLTSEACNDRIFAASQRLDSAVLQTLREELISANEATLAYARLQVDLTNADLEKRSRGEHGKPNRSSVDFIYLKMLHETVTEKKENNAVNELIGAMKQAFTPQAPGSDPSMILEEVETTVPEGAVVLSAEEAAKYRAYTNRVEAMAKAREAKQAKETEQTNEDSNS